MLIEQQIGERQARAGSAVARILERPAGGPYGDYKIKSNSGKIYRVAVRGPGLFENYCSCPDFAVNTLGTCKHIEAMLLRQRYRKAMETAAYKRTRASLSLQYGDSLEVRLHLPASPSPTLRKLAAEHFDPAGVLPRTKYRQFGQVLEAFRNADDRAVVYSDALEYIEWENELADGLDLERKLLGKIQRGLDPTAGLLRPRFCHTRCAEPCLPPAGVAWSSPTTWGWEKPCRRWLPRSYCAAAKASRECW